METKEWSKLVEIWIRESKDNQIELEKKLEEDIKHLDKEKSLIEELLSTDF